MVPLLRFKIRVHRRDPQEDLKKRVKITPAMEVALVCIQKGVLKHYQQWFKYEIHSTIFMFTFIFIVTTVLPYTMGSILQNRPWIYSIRQQWKETNPLFLTARSSSGFMGGPAPSGWAHIGGGLGGGNQMVPANVWPCCLCCCCFRLCRETSKAGWDPLLQGFGECHGTGIETVARQRHECKFENFLSLLSSLWASMIHWGMMFSHMVKPAIAC